VPKYCVLRQQLGITADPTGCGASPDGSIDGPIDAAVPPDAAVVYPREEHPGCCESGDGRGPAAGLTALGVLALMVRRRRLSVTRS
jgi:MYXO-CTERM domain-containing protein